MSKRPSTQTTTQAECAQKARRISNGGAESQSDSPAVDSESDTSKFDISTLICDNDFESLAADYIVSLRISSVPTPKVDEYLAYQQTVCPTAPKRGVTKAWARMKEYFSNIDETNHLFGTLINVASLVSAFKEAPYIDPAISLPPLSLPLRSSVTPSVRSRSASLSGGSNGSPTQSQVVRMNVLFNENFNNFRGSSWSLPSGDTLDERLGEVIQYLPYESTLHSFVIEDVDALLKMFNEPEDQEAIRHILITRKDEELPALSPAERNFLQQYVMPPDDLDETLGNHGWRGMSRNLQEKPSEDFQRVAHNCVMLVHIAYRQNRLTFPVQPSEAWFNTQLWGFLSSALSCCSTLEYKPGEVTSEASSRRRNKQRTQDSRQYTGHKVDGMVVMSARALEICHMEASKKDGGANTTKSLSDTRKLCKLMKDTHDAIREQMKQDIRERLVTFGLRISGPTMTVFTLRQRPGRFYQVVEEVTESLPSVWLDDKDTHAIITVISWILRLRKAILATTESVKTWIMHVDNQDSDSHHDWIAPTMTSPCLLSTPVIPTQHIPPLVL
ncbi:hypothetical protein BGW38_007376 [Lunasporangiospora selenospora]|uniref:Uncharacterized protein n=1 Tax=Lunasporangiospora selenospora TaxID=979761 RepID=A0A9P6FZP5_9FUNG|nr:hypothetical protein BGW38_007376 [Lunasporangiospora selenospora]